MAEDNSREDRGEAGQPPAQRGKTAPSTGGSGPREESGRFGPATRRQLLKAGVGFGAVGVAGYGYLRSQDDVVAATDGSTVDDVPGRSEFVFSWTGTELFRTDGFEAAVDQELGVLSIDEAGTTGELFETISAGSAIEHSER
jgi:hypothetical protein